LSFRVLPHFYQTLWFYAMCAAVIGFTAITAYRRRIRILTIRAEAAAFERARVAREIHDTLLQDLSGASLMLQPMSEKIPDDRLRRQFGMVLDRVEHCLGETRRALWNMREADSRDWITRLRDYVETYSSAAGPRVLIDVSRTSVPPLGAREHDLLRIGQEAALNALKHSSASEIRITISFSSSSLRLAVHDDGQGFNPEWQPGPTSHWGLIGMRERAEKIGAQLTVRSSFEHGTTVEVVVPLGPSGGSPIIGNSRSYQ